MLQLAGKYANLTKAYGEYYQPGKIKIQRQQTEEIPAGIEISI